MTSKLKTYKTIACCGIDCGLCPRFYTKGSSRCEGCGGLNFQGNPSCGTLKCSTTKGLEVCAECNEYPCKKFSNTVKIGSDSFVTHKKIFHNMEDIKVNGLELFLKKQKIRIDILQYLLDNHDNGRTKGFYCIACTLLPIDKLQEIQRKATNMTDSVEQKERCKQLRFIIKEIAYSMNIELKLDKKNTCHQ